MDIRKDEENTCGYMTRCSGGVVLFQKMLTKFSGNLFQQNGLIHQMLRFTEESPVGSGNPLPPKWLYFKACWWNDLGTPPPGNKGKRPNPGWWNMVQPSRHLAILDFMTGLWTIGFLNKVLLDLYFWRGCTSRGGWLISHNDLKRDYLTICLREGSSSPSDPSGYRHVGRYNNVRFLQDQNKDAWCPVTTADSDKSPPEMIV